MHKTFGFSHSTIILHAWWRNSSEHVHVPLLSESLTPSETFIFNLLFCFVFIVPILSCFQKRLVMGDYDCFVFSFQHQSQPVKPKLKPHWLSIISWQDPLGGKEWLFLTDFSSIFLSMYFQDFYPPTFFPLFMGERGLMRAVSILRKYCFSFPLTALFLRLCNGDESFFV